MVSNHHSNIETRKMQQNDVDDEQKKRKKNNNKKLFQHPNISQKIFPKNENASRKSGTVRATAAFFSSPLILLSLHRIINVYETLIHIVATVLGVEGEKWREKEKRKKTHVCIEHDLPDWLLLWVHHVQYAVTNSTACEKWAASFCCCILHFMFPFLCRLPTNLIPLDLDLHLFSYPHLVTENKKKKTRWKNGPK